jgi:hypothetical protein
MHTRIATALALAAVLMLAGCGGGGGGVTPEPAPPGGNPTGPDAPRSSTPGGSPSTTSPASPATPIAAELTITLDETGDGATRTFTLTCAPAGGNHPQAQAACAALAAAGPEAFAPVAPDRMCTEIYGGPQVATVTGTVAGQPVNATFSRTDGCEIARWDALADLLGSPGGADM